MIKKYKLEDFKGGWFIGSFEPTLCKTKLIEVSVKKHPKGEIWDAHYHKIATEYNCITEGSVEIDDKIYSKGDIFVVPPEKVVDPNFIEDCTIVCIKIPGELNDKYVISN